MGLFLVGARFAQTHPQEDSLFSSLGVTSDSLYSSFTIDALEFAQTLINHT